VVSDQPPWPKPKEAACWAAHLLRLKDETVIGTVCVAVVPGDNPSRVYAVDNGALKRPGPCARSVYGRKGAIGGAPEAVQHKAPVVPETRNHPSRFISIF